jgi:tetratricopeptide (TPR) repeat protein
MEPRSPSPTDPTPLHELNEPLRRAVEQVRASTPPPAGVERAMDRVRRLGPPQPRRPLFRRWPQLAAGLAALVLVGTLLWLIPSRPSRSTEQQVALSRTASREEQTATKMREKLETETEKKSESGWTNGTGREATLDDRKEETKAEDRRTNVDLPSPKNEPARPDSAGDNKDAPIAGESKTPTTTPTGPVPPGDVSPTITTGSGTGGGSGSGKGLSTYTTAPRVPPAPHGMMPGGVPPGMPGRPPVANRPDTERAGNSLPVGQPGQPGGPVPPAPVPSPVTARDVAQDETEQLKLHAGYSGKGKDGKEVLEKQKRLADLEVAADEYRQMQEANRRMPRAVTPQEEEAARKRFEKAKKAYEETTAREKTRPANKGPVVWHRDRARPTFARVYVGAGNSLELVSLRVSVTVEGPRARTLVDHVFRNPHARQLEGTFEYPLPSGASPCYFAMFLGQTRPTAPPLFGRRGDTPELPADALVRLGPAALARRIDTADWGELREARVVSQEKALETYEEVVRGRVDPALLEYAGGNTFSGRVFPIPPSGYNRVLLAYEELLPVAQEQMVYRFPLPGCKLHNMEVSLQASGADSLKPAFAPEGAERTEAGGRLTWTRRWTEMKPEGEVLFTCRPAHPEVQAVTGRQGENGPHYLYARLRPQLESINAGHPAASHAVFLLDTSLSEHPDRFGVSMKLLQRILATDPAIKQFNVLTFNVGAAWLNPAGWMPNTPEGRDMALAKLDGLVLEGATDVGCALDKLVEPGFKVAAGTPLDCFLLSDGHVTWGEPDVAALVAKFEKACPFQARFYCYRTGLGEENQELFQALTRKGGGVFQCFGEADLPAAARAHRRECLQVERIRFVGGPAASDVLVAGRKAAVYPGGELILAARCAGTGKTTVMVEGKFRGKPFAEEFPLEVRGGGELAPRGWAEVAVSSLLALHDPKLDHVVTAYCQQFGIASRVASFLVLENDADYKRFNLEEERGKTIAEDLADFLNRAWEQLAVAPSVREDCDRFLRQVNPRVHLLDGPNGAHVARLLALLSDADFERPASPIRGGLLRSKDISSPYLADREHDRREVSTYLAEARRRADAGDIDAAVRVLSSIIEEHPGRSDALRLVGYRLLDLGQPAQAAQLFQRVQRQRPFEPHSYRDLAHALEESGRYGLAALQYEAVLAGTWHARFGDALKAVVREEYARMMQDAIRRKLVSRALANQFGERLEGMSVPQPRADLRVTISWNTDATDVDLWVIEPDGTKCFYQHNRTKNGGELSQDQTQGYGPERYQVAKAQQGVYTILVHYYGVNRNLLGGETHVKVNVVRNAGSPQEQVQRHTVILKRQNEQVEVCKIKF